MPPCVHVVFFLFFSNVLCICIMQVGGGSVKESKTGDEDGYTDPDDDDDDDASKTLADKEEMVDNDDVQDKWSRIPHFDQETKQWQYMAVEEDETQVRFAIRVCHGSSLRMAVISSAFPTYFCMRWSGQIRTVFTLFSS